MLSKLKKARLEAGITQKELASSACITAQYLGKLESGKASNPSRMVMEALANVLDTTVVELFYN